MTTRNGASAPRVSSDLFLLAASLAAGLGAARLTQAPASGRVVGSIVATVVVGHLATTGAARQRARGVLVLGSGVVAVVLATLWGPLLSATRFGVPTATTWHELARRLDQAGTAIRSNPTPVPAVAGVVLCIATGAGLIAVLGRALWAVAERRATRPLAAPVALVPSFGLFCYTSLLSSEVDRIEGVVAYLASALAFVLAADRPPRPVPVHRPAPGGGGAAPPPTPVARTVASAVAGALPAVLVASLAVAVPLAVSPSLTSLKVDALPFGQPGGAGGTGGAGEGPAGGGTGGGTSAAGTGSAGGGESFGPPAPGVRTIDLVDNLQSVLTARTGELMFSASTAVPTYWQIAVLTRYDGNSWLPDPATEAAAEAFAQPQRNRAVDGLPALPEPRGTSVFRSTVTIADLETTLLPLPPTTLSLDTPADVVPGFGAVQEIESPPGETYSAVARVPANALHGGGSSSGGPKGTGDGRSGGGDGSKASGAPASSGPRTSSGPGTPASTVTTGAAPTPAVGAAELAPYLALPAVSPQVVRLAHQIVAGAGTPATQALALARWFDNGRFRYTLSPPASTGPDPLSWFLFSSRQGFCQQFAAAFAVLARIDGLPTRVAVGFTTGSAEGHGEYRVTGADAHVWPEVYLGPSVGWTSYEPTPATSGEADGVGITSGSRSATKRTAAPSTASTASTVTPGRRPVPNRPPVPSTVPLVPHQAAPRHAVGPRPGTGTAVTAVALLAAAGAVVGIALWARRRRWRRTTPGEALDRWRHRRRPSHADPTAEVLARWHDAQWTLERARLGRRPEETPQEHAGRLQALAGAKWLVPQGAVTAPSAAPGPGTPAPPTARPGPSAPGASTTRPVPPPQGQPSAPPPWSPVVAGRDGGPGSGTGAVDVPAVEAAVDAYERLAALAVRALYAGDPCTTGDALDAGRLGEVVRAGLARPPGRGRHAVPW